MTLTKRFLTITIVALSIAILSASLAAPAFGQPPQQVKVLITFAHQPGPAEQALVRHAGGTIKHTYHLVPAIAATLPEHAVSALQTHPRVLRVEPDLVGRAIDVELDNAWGVKRIGAGQVHDTATQGEGVGIAIVDSGINYNHPDLRSNYVGGENFVEPGGDPMDVYGHGTHVAGTACAANNGNGVEDPKLGVVGVAPSCALYSLRVLDDNGYGYASDTIAAMQWAVGHDNIHVANLSLGWDPDPGATFQAAFDNAWEAGLVIVAAAGNSGNRSGRGDKVTHPAKYESVIAVAATNADDDRATFSSTGDQVELAAPGEAIYSTWNDDTGYYDPQPVCVYEDNEEMECYKYGSGTSMATPHVAGTAALIIASGIVTDANGNGRINDEVRLRMNETADDLGAAGRDIQFGYGLVNAVEAVGSPDPVTDVAIAAVQPPDSVVEGDTVTVDVTVENVGNQDVSADVTVTLTDDTAGETIGAQTISGLSTGGSETLSFSWDTAGASYRDHTLTATHALADADPTNDSASATVSVKESTSTIHVGDLDGSTHVKGKSGKWEAFVTVTIHDQNHNPVSRATVYGAWEGAAEGTVSGVTASDGTVTLSTGEMNGGSDVTFTVTDVDHASLPYEETMNQDPDGDSDGTTITVSKP